MAESSSSTGSLSPAASDTDDDLSGTILPYQYEPEGSEVDSEDPPDDDMRLNNTNW